MESLSPNNIPDLKLFLKNPDSLAAQSTEIQLAIANNPETPRDLLAVLVDSNDSQVAEEQGYM